MDSSWSLEVPDDSESVAHFVNDSLVLFGCYRSSASAAGASQSLFIDFATTDANNGGGGPSADGGGLHNLRGLFNRIRIATLDASFYRIDIGFLDTSRLYRHVLLICCVIVYVDDQAGGGM